MRARQFLVLTVLFVVGTVTLATAQTNEWHGLTLETLTSRSAKERGLYLFEGALVKAARPGTPSAGQLAVGDVVSAVEIKSSIKRVATARDLVNALNDVPAGGTALLIRNRAGAPPEPVAIERPKTILPTPAVLKSAQNLMLDTGGHMAIINDLAFTPDSSQLVSAGDDKVVRIWDLSTGNTVRMIRGEVSPGSPGKIFAMALSPDGRWLAIAGWMKMPKKSGHHVRIYDFASGTLEALLFGHTNVVLSLAFGPAGRRLVSGQGGNSAHAILWQAPVGRNGAADWRRARMKRLKGHTDRIYAVGFLPNGRRAVTASYDKTIRIWDSTTGRFEAEFIGHKDRIRSLAVAPNGTVASGDISGEIRIWSARDAANASNGEQISVSRALPIKIRRSIGSLAFSPDSRSLLAAKSVGRGTRRHEIWDVATGTVAASYTGHDNIVLAGAWSPDGRWVATAGGNRRGIHVWSPRTGKLGRTASGRNLILRGRGRTKFAAGFSADGQWIAWGSSSRRTGPAKQRSYRFGLRLPLGGQGVEAPVPLSADSANSGNWRYATTAVGSWKLRHRKGGNPIRPEGVLDFRDGDDVIASIKRDRTTGYRHRSYSFTPDRQTIVSAGSNGALISYRLNGRARGRYIGHESEVWATTPSSDGRYLVSASGDQTIRLWNLKTRELLVTLFHAPASKTGIGDWVMYTPQGFYTGSPNAGKLVGWQSNNGADRAADYVTGGQLRKSLNRRDIVAEAIRLASAKAAVEKLAPQHDLQRMLAARPPEIILATPEPYSEEFRGAKMVTVFVKQGTYVVDRYAISVNGISVKTARVDALPIDHPRPPKGYIVEGFSVPLGDGENDITIKAFSQAGESAPINLRVSHAGEGPLDRRGTLHIVAIGVDKYPGLGQTCGSSGNQSCDLSYAGKDARLFAETIKRELGPRHSGGVKMRILANDAGPENQPTAANILNAIRDAVTDGPIDTVALFIAGHGETGLDGNYYFLPTDIERKAGFEAVGTGRNILNWSQIQERITRSLGRKLIFLDSCQSGAAGAARAYNARLLEDARYENFVAFMAAGPNQYAIERDDVGHGLFTHVLSRGMKGAARRPGERSVRVTPLASYIAEQVRELSHGRQVPVFSAHQDFVLVAK